jgi:DNA-binding transcriptional LysR family regulator
MVSPLSDSLEMMKRAVIANLGIAFFARLAFRREIAAGELMHISLVETSLKGLKLGVMIPTARKLSVATAMTLEHSKGRAWANVRFRGVL